MLQFPAWLHHTPSPCSPVVITARPHLSPVPAPWHSPMPGTVPCESQQSVDSMFYALTTRCSKPAPIILTPSPEALVEASTSIMSTRPTRPITGTLRAPLLTTIRFLTTPSKSMLVGFWFRRTSSLAPPLPKIPFPARPVSDRTLRVIASLGLKRECR